MEGLARAELEQEGLPAERMTARRFLDVRYVGQSFELTVDFPTSRASRSSEGLARAISDSFYRAHLQRFGYADRAEPVEIVNLRLKLDWLWTSLICNWRRFKAPILLKLRSPPSEWCSVRANWTRRFISAT